MMLPAHPLLRTGQRGELTIGRFLPLFSELFRAILFRHLLVPVVRS